MVKSLSNLTREELEKLTMQIMKFEHKNKVQYRRLLEKVEDLENEIKFQLECINNCIKDKSYDTEGLKNGKLLYKWFLKEVRKLK